MSKMSLLDKIKVFFEVSKSSSWFLLIISLLLVVGIVLIRTNKKNTDRNKKIYIAFALIVTSLVVLNYHESINNIFDYMMNNLFIAIYFPNLAIYFAAIIITNVIVWISIFNFKTSEIIKRLNVVIYMIINYLLFLILNVVSTNKLDVFSRDSIYKNTKATALIELSSIIFIIWIVFLIVYKIILVYLRKDYKPKVKKILVKKEIKKLPENYEPVNTPNFIYGNIPQKINIEVDQKEEELKKVYEDMLTLDDYKQILELLKNKKKKPKKIIVEEDIKEKQKEESIKLERIKIELLKQREKEKEQNNFTELENLYRSIS